MDSHVNLQKRLVLRHFQGVRKGQWTVGTLFMTESESCSPNNGGKKDLFIGVLGGINEPFWSNVFRQSPLQSEAEQTGQDESDLFIYF